jgi:hypothetical protein
LHCINLLNYIRIERNGSSLALGAAKAHASENRDAKGEKTRIARDRIDSLRELAVSLMPEKLLDALTPQERRDLFRYLQSPGK